MEDKVLVDGNLGEKAKYDLSFKEGKLVAELMFDSAVADAGLVIKLDSDAIIEAIKLAIPGHFDDMLLDAAKGLLKK